MRVGDDALIAELAKRQNGRVSRAQLLSAGLTSKAIAHRVRTGRLHREHDGVYAVGYRTHERWGRWRSALLKVGVDAALSHLAAAAAHGFGADPVVIDVSCPRRLRSPHGIRLHHRTLEPRDVVRLNGLPLTSPARTLFDLAHSFEPRRLAEAANEAFVEQLLTIADLRETGARNAGRKGSVAFKRLLATLDPEGREIRSPLEPASTPSSVPAATRPGSRTPPCGSAGRRSAPTSSGARSG